MTPTPPPFHSSLPEVSGQGPCVSAELEPLPSSAPVVIIGAAIPALSAAYHLALHGVPPVVLLPREDLLDASTRGLGLVMPGMGEDPARLARAVGVEEMGAFFRVGRDAVTLLAGLAGELEIGWSPTPALMLARGAGEAADVEASAALLEAAGIEAHLLRGETLAAEAGPGFRAGLRFEAAGLVDPVRLSSALARAAEARGAHLCRAARVTGIEERADGLRVVTSRGAIDTEVVIHAGGVETAGSSPFLATTLMMARVQFLATAPVPDGSGPQPRQDAGPKWPGTASSGLEYWRRGPDGGLWLGGFRYLSEELGLALRDDALDPRVTARQEAVLATWCGGTLPPITHRWTRLIDLACDNVPLVGPIPGQPRQLLVTGFGGLDASYGLVAARSVVEALLEVPVTTPLPELFAPRRMV